MSMLRRETPATMTLRTAVWASGRAFRLLLRQLLQSWRLLIFAVLSVLSGFFLVASLPQPMCGVRSKEKLAEMQLERLVFAAYTRWSLNNPDRNCPTDLDDLAPYTEPDDLRDPWGTSLAMVCGLPSDDFGLVSAGPDGAFRTPDDVLSWEPDPRER